MATTERENAFVDATSASIGRSQMFTITSGFSDPTYVVLSLLDRNEYTSGPAARPAPYPAMATPQPSAASVAMAVASASSSPTNRLPDAITTALMATSTS
jgi:hypothetical protein